MSEAPAEAEAEPPAMGPEPEQVELDVPPEQAAEQELAAPPPPAVAQPSGAEGSVVDAQILKLLRELKLKASACMDDTDGLATTFTESFFGSLTKWIRSELDELRNLATETAWFLARRASFRTRLTAAPTCVKAIVDAAGTPSSSTVWALFCLSNLVHEKAAEALLIEVLGPEWQLPQYNRVLFSGFGNRWSARTSYEHHSRPNAQGDRPYPMRTDPAGPD